MTDWLDLLGGPTLEQEIREAGAADVYSFAMLLRHEPTLMPSANGPITAERIEHRSLDEIHPCLRCGGRAQVAYGADLPDGDRWLDLCAACGSWLWRGLDVIGRVIRMRRWSP